MYYMSAFNERYLLDAFNSDQYSKTLRAAFNAFNDGFFREGHQLCDEIKNDTTTALVLAALFSQEGESEEDFAERHMRDLKLAATKGDALAEYSLAYYLESGEDSAQNKAESEKYYQLSADSGMPLACHVFGVMLYYAHNTETVTVDKDKAMKLLAYAAECDVEEARIFLESLG